MATGLEDKMLMTIGATVTVGKYMSQGKFPQPPAQEWKDLRKLVWENWKSVSGNYEKRESRRNFSVQFKMGRF